MVTSKRTVTDRQPTPAASTPLEAVFRQIADIIGIDGRTPERLRVTLVTAEPRSFVEIRVATLLTRTSGAFFPTKVAVRIPLSSIQPLIDALTVAQTTSGKAAAR